jgi:hypothetical protein
MSSQPKLMVDVELVEAVAVNEVGVVGVESVTADTPADGSEYPLVLLTVQIINV